MKKVSIITLSLVMLINSGVAFSAPKKRRNSGGMTPTATASKTTSTPITLEELEAQKVMEAMETSITTKKEKEVSELLSILNQNMQEAKSSCLGIKDELKTIQVLAGVSTGASSLGTLTSGGALATGIVKSVKDKKIEESKQSNDDIERLLNMSDSEFEQAILNGEVSRVLSGISDDITREDVEEKQTELQKEIAKDESTSQTLGNVRTGLMAGSIATSATSTITSGINIKKLDDLIDKMKSCNASVNSLKTNLNNVMAEEADTDLTIYQNIANSCNDLDSNNIKDIKGVMTASTIVGGIGTATSVAGTITSALANTEKVRKDDSEEGVKKEKGLNLASNIMAGVTTGTSAGGIVLGAVTLKKLQDNVDRAERCEKVLK
ncbi:MAG: hypothetical protein ACI4N3_04075 [Alphaproteobacteria bacterium]